MNSYDYHGPENYNNPNNFEVRSYTFGEPLELVVERLMARVDALEAQLSDERLPICGECPGAGNGCCLDD